MCDEPETIAELEAALERFEAPDEAEAFRLFNPGIDDQPHDSGVVIIDLPARLVAYESTYSSMVPEGWVSYHDGHCATELSVSFHVSDDWKFIHHTDGWQSLAAKRRGTPDGEFGGHTPRRISHNERARLPEGVSGQEAMIDCDCPLCQMQSEMPGPVFWCLDGANMDEDFAFSFHRTYEEWAEEQRRWEEYTSRSIPTKAGEQGGVERLNPGPDKILFDEDTADTSGLFAPVDPAESSTVITLFKIAAPLAELIAELKQPPENRPVIDRLNRDFGNLRDVVVSTSSDQTAALLEPVINRFLESLSDLRCARPDLDALIASVCNGIRQFPAEEDCK